MGNSFIAFTFFLIGILMTFALFLLPSYLTNVELLIYVAVTIVMYVVGASEMMTGEF